MIILIGWIILGLINTFLITSLLSYEDNTIHLDDPKTTMIIMSFIFSPIAFLITITVIVCMIIEKYGNLPTITKKSLNTILNNPVSKFLQRLPNDK